MADDTKPKLSEKQAEVLKLHNEGKNATEIAKTMGIKPNGVHAHIRRLRGKGVIPAAASSNGSRKSSTRKPRAAAAKKPAARRTRRTSAPRAPRQPASVKALEKAAKDAAKRIDEIDAEIKKLEGEKAALISVRVSPATIG